MPSVARSRSRLHEEARLLEETDLARLPARLVTGAAEAANEAGLERGRTGDAMDLSKAFRGREPEVEPLLERRGLE